jgi:hypothetical protein
MRYLLLLLSLTLCFGVWAQDRVYKRVNPDGSVEYSDRPLEDAEVIKVPKGSTFTMPAASPARRTPPRPPSADDVEGYESLEITSPKNDEAIRSNDGRVTALAKSDPTLLEGHRYRWSIDGTILPRKLKDPILLMKEVDRGTHSLEVAIIDGEGKVVISSQKITFHLLRASVN